MDRSLISLVGLALVALAAPALAATAARIAYPAGKRVDQVDDYHGVRVADPYRWLEDTDSPETREWVDAENKISRSYLDSIPEREAIRTRITQLWNYERFGMPTKRGGRYFYGHNTGLQNQSVLLVADSLQATPRVLLDPNTLSKDGTVALSGTAISWDGRYLAYGLSTAGSDWQEWHVRDVTTGQDLPDDLKWVKFSGASWTRDNRGFFYSRYDEPKSETLRARNLNQKLYYHRLNTPQEQDVLVYQRPDHPDWMLSGNATDDGRYLILDLSQPGSDHNRVFYRDLKDPQAPAVEPDRSPVVELLPNADARYGVVDNEGPVLYVYTDLDAPRGRIVAIDTRQPEPAHWREVVPQAADSLENASIVGSRMILNYLHDAHSQVRVFGLDGKPAGEVALPGLGSVSGFGGEKDDPETFYAFTSFTTPTEVFRYDASTGQSTLFRKPEVAFDPAAFETKQVFYSSKDGTRVPMFLTYRKGLKLNGKNPTILTGYGGFNISETPGFSPGRVVWMEMGGVVAVPNLRGGGEYGQEWHLAGTKLHKQNVFDDFIAAAEWLIANKYTSSPRLAISGGSNGGLLVGACETQRPDLFGACLPAVGVMDMLRFQKFTIGWAWVSDYGSSDDPAEFKALYAYSPLHNIHPSTKYPPTLITTSDHDDRVVPGHSYKFAATMQAAQAGGAPILLSVETRAGHGGGKPTDKIISELADSYAFLVRNLKMRLPERFETHASR